MIRTYMEVTPLFYRQKDRAIAILVNGQQSRPQISDNQAELRDCSLGY